MYFNSGYAARSEYDRQNAETWEFKAHATSSTQPRIPLQYTRQHSADIQTLKGETTQVIRIPASKIQDVKYRQDIHQDDETSTSQQVQCQYINGYSEVFWRMPQIITKVASCILYPIKNE